LNKTILNRLAALESRQAPPTDDGALDRINKQLDLIAERMRASPGYVPPTPEQIEKTKRNLEEAIRLYGTRQ
jgi:DNA-binding ferritin-like protein